MHNMACLMVCISFACFMFNNNLPMNYKQKLESDQTSHKTCQYSPEYLNIH